MARKQNGFSLVEMLVVVVLLAIILPAMLSSFTVNYVMVKETRLLEIAKHVGQTVMERSLSDDNPQSMTAFETFSSELPNFTYRREFDYDSASGTTLITVIVRYPFLSQVREYRTVGTRYYAG